MKPTLQLSDGFVIGPRVPHPREPKAAVFPLAFVHTCERTRGCWIRAILSIVSSPVRPVRGESHHDAAAGQQMQQMASFFSRASTNSLTNSAAVVKRTRFRCWQADTARAVA